MESDRSMERDGDPSYGLVTGTTVREVFPSPARIAAPVTFWPRLQAACAAGVLLGVQYGLAAILILVAVSWVLGDYSVVRQRALRGQQAWEQIQAAMAAQRSPTSAPRPGP